MSKMQQSTVRAFIAEHLASDAELNATSDSGSHLSYLREAARKRGLKEIRVGDRHYYFLDAERVVGGVKNMVTSLVSSVAVSAATSKRVTRTLYEAHGVPMARGMSVDHNLFE